MDTSSEFLEINGKELILNRTEDYLTLALHYKDGSHTIARFDLSETKDRLEADAFLHSLANIANKIKTVLKEYN